MIIDKNPNHNININNLNLENNDNKDNKDYKDNKEKIEKIENCLFFDKFSKKLFSTNCNILLTIKSKNLERFIEISQFEFFWLNKNQIKTKDEKCLNPVETTIIKNGKISYHGYIDIRDCIIDNNSNDNDSNNDSNNSNNNFNLNSLEEKSKLKSKSRKNLLQYWKINEDNRIINLYNKKCLINSNENKPIISLWENYFNNNNNHSYNHNLNLIAKLNLKFSTNKDNKNTLNNIENNNNDNNNRDKENNSFNLMKNKINKFLNEFKINEIYLGDCYGNTKGYNGREIFILEEFKTKKLEFLALNKLINVYKKGTNKLDTLITKSSNDMIKIIKINSNLIDNRQLIDSIENKLEESQNKFDKFSSISDIENFYEKDGILKKAKNENNYEIYGLAFEKINININNDIDNDNNLNRKGKKNIYK